MIVVQLLTNLNFSWNTLYEWDCKRMTGNIVIVEKMYKPQYICHNIYHTNYTCMYTLHYVYWTLLDVIILYLDLQLPVHSVPITTNGCEFEPRWWRGVFVTTLRQVGGFLRVFWIPPPIELTGTIAEILLKVALNTINLNQTIACSYYSIKSLASGIGDHLSFLSGFFLCCFILNFSYTVQNFIQYVQSNLQFKIFFIYWF